MREWFPTALPTLLSQTDVSVLCLPDDAAREAVALITNPHVRVIDASTAHRTAAGHGGAGQNMMPMGRVVKKPNVPPALPGYRRHLS